MQNKMPLVALRDTVVFPKSVIPLFIGRPKSIRAIEQAFAYDRLVVFVTQKDPTIDVVNPDDLFRFGTVCHIDQMITLTDGTVKILADGIYRAIIDEIIDGDTMCAEVTEVASDYSNYNVGHKNMDALRLAILSNFETFCKQNKKLPADVLASISSIEDPSKLCDTIASYLPLKISERQNILEIISVSERLEKLIYLMEEQSELVLVEKKIKNRVKKQVEKNQKEYYLNEQLKAIYKELGDAEDVNQESQALVQQVKKSNMSTATGRSACTATRSGRCRRRITPRLR